ncbi:hypothetical protein [Streptomyces sp. NPDC055990]|uniref:hypothetical protein n=1 Tax=Streptomyces sp. NPDC055990 TaxID=3345672 RepID=UPI0035DC05D1
MIAKAPASMLLGWRLEKCGDTNPVTGLEEARWILTAHSEHHCGRYLLALQSVSAAM